MAEGNADEDVLARCRATADRAATGGVAGADVAAFVADLAGLPPGHPERSRLAVTMVIALTKGGGSAPLELMGHLDGLLRLVERVPPSLAVWPRVRASARAQHLAHAVVNSLPVDLPAAERELAELAEIVWDAPVMRHVVEAGRRVVAMASAHRAGDESMLLRVFDDLSPVFDRFGDHPDARAMRSFTEAVQETFTAARTGDVQEAIRLMRVLDERSAALPLPPDTGLREVFRQARDAFDVLSTAFDGTAPEGDPREAAERIARSLAGSGAPLADRVDAQLVAATALFRAGEETDPARMEAAIDQYREAVALGGDDDRHAFALTGLAVALYRRTEVLGTTEGLDEAERALARALDLMGGPRHPQWALANEVLAGIRQRTGDLAAAGEFGMAAQRNYAWRALLESDAAGARIAIRDAVRGAIDLAHTCLRANNVADALRALDTCRGLMLFAEVELRDVPTRLRAAGRADLADRWVREGRDAAGLRRDVVTALLEHSGGLLDPPGLGEIRTALAATGADALVYLVPGEAARSGLAVIAPAEGPPAYMTLPHLVVEDDEVERYLAALANRSREVQPVEGAFGDRLDALCDWAWRAAVGPLLERYFARTAPGRVPRVVLIPMGDLARIPWQAARRSDGTYAVQLAAFSHAVSARLFCENAARPPIRPTSTGLVVGDPDTAGAAAELVAARVEAHAVRQAFYRGARYVGRRPDGTPSPSGRGTAGEVRDWLADAAPHAGTTLHLACHGSFTPDGDDVKAALLLAPERPDGAEPGELGTDEIVRVLQAVPERRIGLVVMAACHTGRSIHGYDEAYSLGTAFLAGGARTVLSTQWAIPDEATSALMFLFHHHLREEGRTPWEALREAQMWMLDPNREPPARMPADLWSAAADHDHAGVVAWAGFVHSGQ